MAWNTFYSPSSLIDSKSIGMRCLLNGIKRLDITIHLIILTMNFLHITLGISIDFYIILPWRRAPLIMDRWRYNRRMIWLPNFIINHNSFLLGYLINLFDIDHRNIYILFIIWVLIFAIFCWENNLFDRLDIFIAIFSMVATALTPYLWGISLNMDLGFHELRFEINSHVFAIIFPKRIKGIQPICPYFSDYKWKTVLTFW